MAVYLLYYVLVYFSTGEWGRSEKYFHFQISPIRHLTCNIQYAIYMPALKSQERHLI
jgi:hypothetical protein